MTHDRTYVYTRITAEIVAAIEAGAGEFKMPWHHNGTKTACPANIASGKGYRGVNVLALWVAAELARYDNGLGAPIANGRRSKLRSARASTAPPSCCGKKRPRPVTTTAHDEDGPVSRIFARAFTGF